MDTNHYTLGGSSAGKYEKILRLIFGLICLLIAVYWVVFGPVKVTGSGTLIIAVGFLILFGISQIMKGLGLSSQYINIGEELIVLKKYPIRPEVQIKAAELDKLQILPMSILFIFNDGKTLKLRFGATWQETNEKIKDDLIIFADRNNVTCEIIEEKL